MTLPFPISSGQTDPRSPVDDNLMDSIRENLDYLDALFTAGGTPSYAWTINGALKLLDGGIAKRKDMQFLHVLQTFTKVRVAQGKGGTSGKTEIDIRYHSKPKTPITGIAAQFQDNTSAISQIAPNMATQSITRATVQVSTQSITRFKSTLNIQSIIYVGVNPETGSPLWRYNLDNAPDSDFKAGDFIDISGCSNAANDGKMEIYEVNQSGHASIVVANGSGVAQTTAAGTVELCAFKYNLTNPASSFHVPGKRSLFAGHTDSDNNGSLLVYAINQGGNNIVVKNIDGATQGGAVGTIDTLCWIYAFSSSAPATFVTGERARTSGHSSGGNNADQDIIAVNSGGNNVVLYNINGVVQGGVAGLVNTLRWKYTVSANPSGSVAPGDTIYAKGHTNNNNNGVFEVKAINDNTNDNIVIYNASGVAQGGAAGTVYHTRKLVKFASDQSLLYSTDSYVELEGCPDDYYNASDYRLPYKVLQINRGGGSNYNIVIEVPRAVSQSSPAGYVAIEAKSIFTADDGSKPQLSVDLTANSANGLLSTESTDIIATPIPAQTFLGLYVLQIQGGNPENLSVMLT